MMKCTKCGQQKALESFNRDRRRRYGYETVCKSCRIAQRGVDQMRRKQKRHLHKTKDAAYEAYGGYRCVCCGITHKAFLTLDHVKSDGSVHRKAITGGKYKADTGSLYTWLRREGYPSGLMQVMCYNCNCGRQRNGGVCPHKEVA